MADPLIRASFPPADANGVHYLRIAVKAKAAHAI